MQSLATECFQCANSFHAPPVRGIGTCVNRFAAICAPVPHPGGSVNRHQRIATASPAPATTAGHRPTPRPAGRVPALAHPGGSVSEPVSQAVTLPRDCLDCPALDTEHCRTRASWCCSVIRHRRAVQEALLVCAEHPATNSHSAHTTDSDFFAGPLDELPDGRLAQKCYFQVSLRLTEPEAPVVYVRLVPDSQVTLPALSLTMYLYSKAVLPGIATVPVQLG